MLEKLMDSPVAWAVLAFCAIFSLFFAIFTWIRGKTRKEFSCYKTSYQIVRAGKSLIPELDLLYRKQEIEDLVITKYAIWNSGNRVLNWNDMVEAKPLKIVSYDEMTKLLDVKIIKYSDESNMFSVEKEGELEATIKFDYAEVNDGLVLQIMHTGKPSDISVECKIKGGKKIKNLNKDKQNSNNKKTMKRLMIIETILVIVYIILGLLGITTMAIKLLQNILQYSVVEIWTSILGGVIVIICIVSIGVMYIKMLKKLYHFSVPAKIRAGIVYDEFEN